MTNRDHLLHARSGDECFQFVPAARAYCTNNGAFHATADMRLVIQFVQSRDDVFDFCFCCVFSHTDDHCLELLDSKMTVSLLVLCSPFFVLWVSFVVPDR